MNTPDAQNRLSTIRVLTFDCYGTLVDWERGLRTAFLETFGPLPEDRLRGIFDTYLQAEKRIESGVYQPYRQVVAAAATDVMEHLGLQCDPSAAIHIGSSVERWPPFPDTGDALRRLASRYRLGILSNVDRDLLAGTLAQFPITFDFIITAQDVRSYKPSDAHLRMCLRRLGGTDGWLHVAQSLYHDGVPCAHLDIPFAWINRRAEANDSAAHPLIEVADMAAFASAMTQD